MTLSASDSESLLLTLRTEIIGLPLGTPGQGYLKDIGDIKDIQNHGWGTNQVRSLGLISTGSLLGPRAAGVAAGPCIRASGTRIPPPPPPRNAGLGRCERH
jgi:hypothetical protein